MTCFTDVRVKYANILNISTTVSKLYVNKVELNLVSLFRIKYMLSNEFGLFNGSHQLLSIQNERVALKQLVVNLSTYLKSFATTPGRRR